MGHCYALFTFQPLAWLPIALIWTSLAMKPAQTPVWERKAFNFSLQTHLEKNGYDINYYILAEDFSGLALIAWEHWRPQWDHNWDAKDVYRRKSRKLITEMEGNIAVNYIEHLPRVSFEESEKAFMKETIALGMKSRPKGLWGYYLYPDCHNYNFCDQNYTGSYPKSEALRNNDLSWLWDISVALYPPTGIKKPLGNSYRDEPLLFLSMVSFCWNNVGCIYALTILADGASGWKTSYLANSGNCTEVQEFVDSELRPYIINVTAAAEGYEGTNCGEVKVADDHPVNSADSVSPRRFAAI
ncbi:unnamed protein product [Bubo scandiacus]